MTTTHEKEVQDAAMAKLAKVHGHRTESAQVPGLFMVASARPRDAEDFTDEGSFWTCAFFLPREGQSRNPPPDLVTRYSMGCGLGYDRKAHSAMFLVVHPPTCDDVLQNLCSEALDYDNVRDFEDWASSYGFDADSRKAEKAYQQIGKTAKTLRLMLGKDYERIVAAGAREWEPEDT